jgi:anaerobic selenocysteine-containing dehydrogenase
MNVIIGEGLTDEAYVHDYTVGYDELAEGRPLHLGMGIGADRDPGR